VSAVEVGAVEGADDLVVGRLECSFEVLRVKRVEGEGWCLQLLLF
jgi:hypothetical protein